MNINLRSIKCICKICNKEYKTITNKDHDKTLNICANCLKRKYLR